MITKISLQVPQFETFYKGVEGHENSFSDHEKVLNAGLRLLKIAQLMSYVAQHPDTKAIQALNMFIGEPSEIKHYTKKKRSYKVYLLTIWEEEVFC